METDVETTNATIAFQQLEDIGATVINHGSPDVQWGAEFILCAELIGKDDNEVVFADYYHTMVKEIVTEDGRILNAFGIDQRVHDILDQTGLEAQWIDAGTIGIYR
jgi:hypothetical protein